MAKSWKEKLNTDKQPKRVELEKPFAGIPAGQMLYVGTPQIVADYINRIPFGETRSITRLREELAADNQCDAMCPVSTAIFIRIVAEAAIEDFNEGKGQTAVTPFWRLVEPDSKIAGRLSIDSQWIAQQRQSELAA